MHNRRKALAAFASFAVLPTFSFRNDGPGAKRSKWEMIFSNHETALPSERPDPASWDNSTFTAAWIGQSTVLLNFYGKWIITDPVFSERIGINILGLFTLGPKRLVFPALDFKDIPRVDLILLSHAHMDHLDYPTLKKFDTSIPMIMAKNTADIIEDIPFSSVKELDWGERTHIADVKIEALRVKHFGWRYPWENDRSKGYMNGRSYNAYLVSKNGKHFVFGADTGYQDFFKEIGKRNLEIDLAIMPIGAYDPWIRNHCNPEQAALMAEHLGAKTVLPTHWGTFVQSDEPTMEPIQRFTNAIRKTSMKQALSAIGETWRVASGV